MVKLDEGPPALALLAHTGHQRCGQCQQVRLQGEELWNRCLPLPPAAGHECAPWTSCDLGRVACAYWCLETECPEDGEAAEGVWHGATRPSTGPPGKEGEGGVSWLTLLRCSDGSSCGRLVRASTNW